MDNLRGSTFIFPACFRLYLFSTCFCLSQWFLNNFNNTAVSGAFLCLPGLWLDDGGEREDEGCFYSPCLDQHVSSDLTLLLHAPASSEEASVHYQSADKCNTRPPSLVFLRFPSIPVSTALPLCDYCIFFEWVSPLQYSSPLSFGSVCAHTSQLPLLCALVHAHTPGHPTSRLWDGQLTLRRRTSLLRCRLKHRSHGRLDDGLGCYGRV